MTLIEDRTYEISTDMARGFTHRYQFLINGVPDIDYSAPKSKSGAGDFTNYIVVPHKETTVVIKEDSDEEMPPEPILNKLPTYIAPKEPSESEVSTFQQTAIEFSTLCEKWKLLLAQLQVDPTDEVMKSW